MRRMAGFLFAGGLAAGLGAGMTAIAHASDPARPAQAWNEIFLPFDNGQGNTMCVAVADGGAGLDVTPRPSGVKADVGLVMCGRSIRPRVVARPWRRRRPEWIRGPFWADELAQQ